MIEENLNRLGHLNTIIREANEEQSSSMSVSVVWLWVCNMLDMLDTKGLIFHVGHVWHLGYM